MTTYNCKNFYKFDDFVRGDLVVCYNSDGKKNIGVIVEKDLTYLKIHWGGYNSSATFYKSEIEELGFGFGFSFCKYKDHKKYKEYMK
jgi:hypothetical protein